MTITRKFTTERISKIVIHNDTVYLCGQVPEDVTGDIVEQSKGVLARVDHYLAEAGTDNTKILSALIHVKHASDAAAFNEVWNAWLPDGCAPARTCVQAEMLRDAILVEVTVTAAL